MPNYYFHQLKSAVKLLPLYNHENDFVRVQENEPQSCEHYIKLSEFRDYILHLQEYDIWVPLPSRIFDKEIKSSKKKVEDNANNNNETFSKLDFPKILSIDIITEKLKQDWLYCDDSFCEDKCNWLINKYTTSENPWDEKKKRFINNHAKKMEPIKILENRGENRPYQKYFLHLLCIYSGLHVYRTDAIEPIKLSGLEYAKECTGDSLIDRNELMVILRKETSYRYPKGLPLPVFWYEDEDNNSKEVAGNNLVEDLKDIITDQLPKFDLDASVEDAKRSKYIALGLLPYVMAMDEQYNAELLLKLWGKYHCDRRGPKKPPIETYENRVGVWYHLFERLANGRVQGVPIKRSSPPYLTLYHFNDEEGVLEKYNRRKDPGDPQVKLEDLKKYFSETIEIPLPASLFPQDVQVKSNSQKDYGIIGNDHGLINTISGIQLMKTWGIGAHELLQLIINGLPALKPNSMSLIEETLSGGIKEIAIRRVLGKHPEKAVPDLIFNITDIQEFKNKHPELPPIEIFHKMDSLNSDKQDEEHNFKRERDIFNEETKKPKVDTDYKDDGDYFKFMGDFLDVRYNKKLAHIKNNERLRYIVYLIDQAHIDINARDLFNLVKGVQAEIEEDFKNYSGMSKEQMEEEGLSLVEIEIEDLSDKDKEGLEDQAYERWNELIKARDKGDEKIIKKRQEELNKLKSYFFDHYGLSIRWSSGGIKFIKKNKPTKAFDKIRINVTQNIRNAIKKDISPHLPELGTHLERSIATGSTCKYDPYPDIEWVIEWGF